MYTLSAPYGYRSFQAEMKSLLSTNTDWAPYVIGYSRQGRPIWALQYGAGGGALIHAAHHANEWITAAVLMRWLWQAHPKMPVTVVPMVNPDGVELVTSCTPAYDHWKANANGVDLNLNYPAGWNQAVSLKESLGVCAPGARDWPGSYPLSEPETQAMARLSDCGFCRSLSLHSQGREIYWDYRHYAPSGAYALAERMAEASGYTVTSPPLTASHGGYKDWFLMRYRKPAYTVEIGMGENPLPIEDFSRLCVEVFPILQVFTSAIV